MTETHTRECKRLWKDDYLKWICGFANAAGGVLEIGRDDDGRAVGVADAAMLLTEIPNKVQTTMGILVDVELTTEGGLDVVTVRVALHTQPISYRGEYYYRSGTTNQKLSGPALSRFILEKMNISWDAITTQRVSRTDLDAGAIAAWRRRALRHDRVDASILEESDADLLTSHESKPWNPRIARAFYRAGVPTPKISTRPEAFDVEFTFSPEYLAGLGETAQETGQEQTGTTQDTRHETRQKPLSASALEIMHLIRENPDITARELADQTSLTFKGVQWNLAQLKELGVLRRVGSKKSGHWEIIDRPMP